MGFRVDRETGISYYPFEEMLHDMGLINPSVYSLYLKFREEAEETDILWNKEYGHSLLVPDEVKEKKINEMRGKYPKEICGPESLIEKHKKWHLKEELN